MSDWGQVHDDLRQFLLKSGKRKLILIPRGHLKSSVVTKGWTIQKVLNNPNLRVLITNSTWDNAKSFHSSIQKYLTYGSYLPHFFGRFDSNQWNVDGSTIRQRTRVLDAPTWTTAGVDKELTSQHYDLIVCDDIVGPKNVDTPEQRRKVYDYYLSLFDLLEPGGELVVIGTRYHQDDLYARIMEENDSLHNWDIFFRTAYNDDGSILYPQKFTKEHLDQIRNKPRGLYHFASQYMNNPIDPDSADFKAEWIHYYDPTTPHPHSLYLTCDPAISLGRDADYTALVVAGQFADRRIRVVDRLHARLMPHDLVDRLFELVQKWRLHRVGIETFAFQKTLKYEIQRQQRERNCFFSIDELGKRHTGRGEPVLSKEARIRRLQPYFEQGLIEIRRDMQDLVDELLSFPRGKHDDLIDALSYQLDYLVPSVTRSRPEETQEFVDPQTKKYGYTVSWWMKQTPEKEMSIYDRFIQSGMK